MYRTSNAPSIASNGFAFFLIMSDTGCRGLRCTWTSIGLPIPFDFFQWWLKTKTCYLKEINIMTKKNQYTVQTSSSSGIFSPIFKARCWKPPGHYLCIPEPGRQDCVISIGIGVNGDAYPAAVSQKVTKNLPVSFYSPMPGFKIILMNFLISLYFNMSPMGTEIASSWHVKPLSCSEWRFY